MKLARTIRSAFQYKELIKKSKFCATVVPCSSMDDIKELLNIYGDQSATHNCWAARIGSPVVAERCSDDGEPAGTAGSPILRALISHQCSNALLIVIRYYGGIKLGTGGLSRAYGKVAHEVLNASDLIEIVEMCTIHCSGPLVLYQAIKHQIQNLRDEESLSIGNVMMQEEITADSFHMTIKTASKQATAVVNQLHSSAQRYAGRNSGVDLRSFEVYLENSTNTEKRP